MGTLLGHGNASVVVVRDVLLEHLAKPLAIVLFAVWCPLELLFLVSEEVGRKSGLKMSQLSSPFVYQLSTSPVDLPL